MKQNIHNNIPKILLGEPCVLGITLHSYPSLDFQHFMKIMFILILKICVIFKLSSIVGQREYKV